MNGTADERQELTAGVATGPGPEHRPSLRAALETPQDGPLSASPQFPCSPRCSFLNVLGPFLSGLGLSPSNQLRWLIFHVGSEYDLKDKEGFSLDPVGLGTGVAKGSAACRLEEHTICPGSCSLPGFRK